MELRKNKYHYIHHSLLLRKFINGLAVSGKAHKLEQFLFQSLSKLKFKVQLNPIMLFLFIVNEIKPCIDLKSLRLGSVVYQIPVPLVMLKQLGRALKLLIQGIRESKQRTSVAKKIEAEFHLILQGKSLLLKRGQTVYQIASNARAFAHYRWG